MTQGFQHTETKTGPTVAIAFGGGGARGLAHIHVIEALDELGIRPVAIAGSSIGAIMGAGMAAGLTGAEIRDHTMATVGRRKEIVNRLWSLRPSSFTQAVTKGFRVGQLSIERILPAFLCRLADPEIGPFLYESLQKYNLGKWMAQFGKLETCSA